MANPGPATTVSIHPQGLQSNQAIRLLAVYKGVNINAVGDTAMPVINTTSYSVSNIVLTNASVSLTTALGGVFTAVGGNGTTLMTSAALSANTSAAVVTQETVATTNAQVAQNLYFRVATAQGAAATADVYVYGYDLS